jgi:hypothetical protein
VLRPFDRFGGEVTAALGLVVALVGIAVTRFGVDFDGVLDIHKVAAPPSLLRAAAEQAIAWFLPALLFWIYAALSKHRTRLIDFVGAAGLSRLPLVLGAFVAALLGSKVTPMMLVGATIVIACLAVSLTLLYQGVKSASGLAGTRLTIGFIGVLIAAEMLSKVILPLAS